MLWQINVVTGEKSYGRIETEAAIGRWKHLENLIWQAGGSCVVLLTVKEVSKILKTNPTYVYKLIDSGKLPTIKLGSYKVRTVALEHFLRQYEGYDLTDPQTVKEIS